MLRTLPGCGRTVEEFDISDTTSWLTCPKCGKTKPAHEFYAQNVRKPKRNCRACDRTAMRVRYLPRMEFIQNYKLERGCSDCGFNGHPAALEFDHLPQFEKKFAISQLLVRMNIPHEVLMEEIAKCEVVCANCHRVRTFDRAQHGGYHDVSRERKQPVESFGPPPFEQLNLEF